MTATAEPVTARMGITVPDDWAGLPEFAGSVAGDVRDPYPFFAEMRRNNPVALRTMTFGDEARGEPVFRAESYWVYGRSDITSMMRDNTLFSNRPHRDSMGRVMGNAILIGMDEPEHRSNRALVSQAFRSKTLESWRTDKVAPIVDELVDRLAGRGYAELVSELTYRVPVQVIANILGVPRRDYASFQEWAFLIHDFGSRPRAAMKAAAAMGEFLLEICETRRRDPQDDVISDLVNAELDGERLSDEEIIAFLRLLLPAGSDTTFRATGNLLYGLLTHPDQLAALTADRTLLKQAIEEGLRWETPLVVDSRRATADTELSGVPIPAGAEVTMVLGSANRDESVYGDTGGDFDIFRKPSTQHITFGVGVHTCLGLHLARIEMNEMVGSVIDALPGLHLDPDWAREFDSHIHGEFFRSPTCLPVRWDPA